MADTASKKRRLDKELGNESAAGAALSEDGQVRRVADVLPLSCVCCSNALATMLTGLSPSASRIISMQAYQLHAQNRGLAINLFRYKRQIDSLTADLQQLRRERVSFRDVATSLERAVETVSTSRAIGVPTTFGADA